jgi:hypothetical protein
MSSLESMVTQQVLRTWARERMWAMDLGWNQTLPKSLMKPMWCVMQRPPPLDLKDERRLDIMNVVEHSWVVENGDRGIAIEEHEVVWDSVGEFVMRLGEADGVAGG